MWVGKPPREIGSRATRLPGESGGKSNPTLALEQALELRPAERRGGIKTSKGGDEAHCSSLGALDSPFERWCCRGAKARSRQLARRWAGDSRPHPMRFQEQRRGQDAS